MSFAPVIARGAARARGVGRLARLLEELERRPAAAPRREAHGARARGARRARPRRRARPPSPSRRRPRGAPRAARRPRRPRRWRPGLGRRGRLEARDGRERARERRAVARRHARHLRQRPERRRERLGVDGPLQRAGGPLRAERGGSMPPIAASLLAHARPAAAAREPERVAQAPRGR